MQSLPTSQFSGNRAPCDFPKGQSFSAALVLAQCLASCNVMYEYSNKVVEPDGRAAGTCRDSGRG